MAITRVRFTEGSAGRITAQLLDDDNTPIPVANVTSAELTLYNLDGPDRNVSPETDIINGRSAQDVKNANDVTIDSEGNIVWLVQPEDNPIITPRRQMERHRAMLKVEWSTGSPGVSSQTIYEWEIEVQNLRKVA